jgi:hypothetical protein
MAAYLVDDLVVVVVVEVAVVRKEKGNGKAVRERKAQKILAEEKLGPAKKACQEWGPWLIR